MKKFNKVLALGMAGSMALSMAACGGSSSSASTGTDGSSTSTAAPTAAPSKDVVTLKWVAVGSGMPSNYDAWLAQINPYLEDKIGVNIDMEVISWGDWDTRRNVIVNTSGEYDILFTNVNTYNNDVNTGAFLDITDMVKEAAPELYASVPEIIGKPAKWADVFMVCLPTRILLRASTLSGIRQRSRLPAMTIPRSWASPTWMN